MADLVRSKDSPRRKDTVKCKGQLGRRGRRASARRFGGPVVCAFGEGGELAKAHGRAFAVTVGRACGCSAGLMAQRCLPTPSDGPELATTREAATSCIHSRGRS